MSHIVVWAWSVLLCLVLCSSESTLLDRTYPLWVPPAFVHLYFLHSDPQTLRDTKTTDNDEPEVDSTFRPEDLEHPQNTPTMPLLGVPGLHSHTFGEVDPSVGFSKNMSSCCERFCSFPINYDIALVLFSFYMDTSFKESLPLHRKIIIYHLRLAQTKVMHSENMQACVYAVNVAKS